MLIFKNRNLTVQIIKKLKLAVFTWRGSTTSELYNEGTVQSLEILRDHPGISRILLNTRDHSVVMLADVEESVKSTVDYISIARGNYRMAVLPPTDQLAEGAINLYVDMLNTALKKRFVVKKIENTRRAFSWLTRPKFCLFFGCY